MDNRKFENLKYNSKGLLEIFKHTNIRELLESNICLETNVLSDEKEKFMKTCIRCIGLRIAKDTVKIEAVFGVTHAWAVAVKYEYNGSTYVINIDEKESEMKYSEDNGVITFYLKGEHVIFELYTHVSQFHIFSDVLNEDEPFIVTYDHSEMFDYEKYTGRSLELGEDLKCNDTHVHEEAVKENNNNNNNNKKNFDEVYLPKHYNSTNIQTRKVLRDITSNKPGDEAGPVYNIIKYAARYNTKNGIRDVEKSAFYCFELLSILLDKEGRSKEEIEEYIRNCLKMLEEQFKAERLSVF